MSSPRPANKASLVRIIRPECHEQPGLLLADGIEDHRLCRDQGVDPYRQDI
jgi:hypothetical protein